MDQAIIRTTKEEIADAILANETYMPDSGLIKQLRKRLLKFPKEILCDLKLIVDLKSAVKS